MIVEVKNRRIHYKIDINSRIAVVRGDSATGKSTFVNLIEMHLKGINTGTEIHSDFELSSVELRDITQSELDNERLLYIMDEGSMEKSDIFADFVNKSKSYFLIVTRNPMPNIIYIYIYEFYTDCDGITKNRRLYDELNNTLRKNNDNINTYLKWQ